MLKFAVFGPEGLVVDAFRDVDSGSCLTIDQDIRLGDVDAGIEFLDETDVEIAVIQDRIEGDVENLIEKAMGECSRVVVVTDNGEEWSDIETVKPNEVLDFFGLGESTPTKSAPREEVEIEEKVQYEEDRPTVRMPVVEDEEQEDIIDIDTTVEEPSKDVFNGGKDEGWKGTESATIRVEDEEIESLTEDIFGGGKGVHKRPAQKKDDEPEPVAEVASDILCLAAKAKVAPVEETSLPRIKKPVVSKRQEVQGPPVQDVEIARKKVKALPLNVKLAFEEPKTIAIYGSSGGVGTTTIALNLGCQFALGSRGSEESPDVLVIDLEMRYGNVGRMLVDKSEPNILSWIETENPKNLKKIVAYDESSGMSVLLGAPSIRDAQELGSEHIKWVLKNATKQYKMVFVDCGVDITKPAIETALTSADVVVFVVEMLRTGLIDTKKALTDIYDMRKQEHGGDVHMAFLINKATEEFGITTRDVIEYFSKVDFLGSIPYSPSVVTKCLNSGNLIPLCGDKTLMKAYQSVGDRLAKILAEMEKGFYYGR